MSDTAPDRERVYRRRLLQRSGAERLRMASSMFTTVRKLVMASIRQEGTSGRASQRQALFHRLYAADFSPGEQERIARWLGREERGAGPASGLLAVNWDDLETALTTSDAGTTFYFDRQTGETVIVAEELDDVIGMPSREDVEDGVVAGRLIQIIPVSSSVEYRWMVEFTATVADDRLRDRLEVALDGRGPFRRFKNALSYHPDERERWFALRDARLREVAREWLAAHGIRAPSPPERRAP